MLINISGTQGVDCVVRLVRGSSPFVVALPLFTLVVGITNTDKGTCDVTIEKF
jgi:hypothetical protein